jgi:catechol 2,3-dioxygenase-like lactoylglutathione lyase family enzyme
MSGAPLPLLGTFHETSIAVADVRAAVEFYERLGFSQASTGDLFSHPYGVLTDGRLFIGLHGREGPSPVLTFVSPGIAQRLAEFGAAGLELTRCRTGEEVFNEVGLEDPFGHALAVLEARTYSPVTRGHAEPSLCGDFAEVSLPVADFGRAREFWEALGFVAAEEAAEPYPHLVLTSDHLDISFHAPQLCPRPMLVFRDPGMGTRLTRLRELGLEPAPLRGAPHVADCARLTAPDGTPLVLLRSEG